MSRLYYYSFSLLHFILLSWAHLMAFKNKRSKSAKGIAALPYYPSDWPGGKERIADWEKIFTKQGKTYHVFSSWSSHEILLFFEAEKEAHQRNKYKLYWKLYWRRYLLLKKLKNYETIWIQRSYIPMFPFRDAYYEKLLSRIHPNVIYDYYDADYVCNETLVYNTIKSAAGITVASPFLKEKLNAFNPNISFVRYAISTDDFLPKKENKDGIIRIGWMGSPSNATELVKIANQLQKIESEFDNIQFTFVCRNLPDLPLKNQVKQKWGDVGFNYYDWLSNLDIGIVPFIEQSDVTKAKISMKSLEFMVAEVAQISSPWVLSDQMQNNITCFISEPEDWFYHLKILIEDTERRKAFAEKAKKVYLNFHSFHSVYPELEELFLTKGGED